MHVLTLPSWYPTAEAPREGIYFPEQMQAVMARTPVRYGVVYPEQQSLRRATPGALLRKRFQTHVAHEYAATGAPLPTVRRLSWNLFWKLPPAFALRLWHARALARRYVARFGQPDLVHAQSAQWAGAAAGRLARTLGVPCVLTEHFSGAQHRRLPPWQRRLMREAYAGADVLAAVSAPLRDALAAFGADPARVHLLPNMVDTAFFTPPPAPRLRRAPMRFVTVARLVPGKRIGWLLQRFAEAFGTDNAGEAGDADGTGDAGEAGDAGVRLTVVGDGPERTRLEQAAQTLGLGRRVTFRGALDRAGVRRALWAADAFVLASRRETFGVVLLEAMATGLPVVATRCGGPDALVAPTTGVLVAPDDAPGFTAALRAMRQAFVEYDPAAVRGHVRQHFGAAAFARRSLVLYRKALSTS